VNILYYLSANEIDIIQDIVNESNYSICFIILKDNYNLLLLDFNDGLSIHLCLLNNFSCKLKTEKYQVLRNCRINQMFHICNGISSYCDCSILGPKCLLT